LKEVFEFAPPLRSDEEFLEFEEFAKDMGYELSEVQKAWAKAVLSGKNTFFVAFTGFGKTTLIRLLAEYLASKGMKSLIVTRPGPARQLTKAFDADVPDSQRHKIDVFTVQGLTAKVKALTQGEADPVLTKEYDYVFADDVESLLDDEPSAWKALVLSKALPDVAAPKVVHVQDAANPSNLERLAAKLFSAHLIDREPKPYEEVLEELKEGKGIKVVENIVGDGPTLKEIFSRPRPKEELKELIRKFYSSVASLAYKTSRAWRVLIGVEGGSKAYAASLLYALYKGEWGSFKQRAPVIISSATFTKRSVVWGFLLGLKGVASFSRLAYFDFHLNEDLVKVHVRKEKVDEAAQAALAVLRVWEEVDFKTNVLVFVDTGLFDVKELVIKGNEELASRGLKHSFVLVKSTPRGFYESKKYRGLKVADPEWLADSLKEAGGEGPYYALVSSASPSSALIRGFDAPKKTPLAVFVGFPSVKTSLVVPSDVSGLISMLAEDFGKPSFLRELRLLEAEASKRVRLPADFAKRLFAKMVRYKKEHGSAEGIERIITEDAERLWEGLKDLKGREIKEVRPNAVVFVQAVGRTARAVKVEDGKVVYHKGIAVVYEWREELLEFLQRGLKWRATETA